MIIDTDAVALARAALLGRVEPQADGPVRITRQGRQITVEFGRRDPPGTRGPDYDARVVVDGETRAIVSVLGGS